MPPATDTLLGTALRCTVAGRAVGVPLLHAGQVIELSAVPLPLSRPWFRGLGLHAGELVIALALDGSAPLPSACGVLLQHPGLPCACALEVESVGGLAPVHRKSGGPRLGGFLIDAVDGEGAPISWLDVPAFLSDALGRGLGGGGR
jgi:hypothetical protein